ncbi:hypothetical protein [Streptosporangium roseum]|uniref:hypothetical protein n=1 Tax=Streptosporangium roseum TaxID=2001 RepID=UPI0011D28DBF|nr:hypothetical protein [Streptosporangium roseum]
MDATIVSGLGRHPGTGNLPQPRLAQVDLSVRVRHEMRLHLIFQRLDLADDHGRDLRLSPHGRAVGHHDDRRLRQLLTAQRPLRSAQLFMPGLKFCRRPRTRRN